VQIDANITLISGTNTAYFPHGTAVLGEMLMIDNAKGGIGIAPSAKGRVISQYQPGGYNTAGAILDAIAHMSFRDFLLLEAQEYDPAGGSYF
jgi:serine protease